MLLYAILLTTHSSILTAAGITTKVNLPAVGTNLQDHALTVQLYEMSPDVNETAVDSSNAPGVGAVAFPNVYQVLGQARGEAFGKQLLSTIKDRAKAIVSSGGFTSQKGAEKFLKYQAQSIIQSKGAECHCPHASHS